MLWHNISRRESSFGLIIFNTVPSSLLEAFVFSKGCIATNKTDLSNPRNNHICIWFLKKIREKYFCPFENYQTLTRFLCGTMENPAKMQFHYLVCKKYNTTAIRVP